MSSSFLKQATFFLILWTAGSAYAVAANECPAFLSSVSEKTTTPKIMDHKHFMQALNEINNSKKLRGFIHEMIAVTKRLRPKDKKQFNKAGFKALEVVSLPLLESLDVLSRESLFRIFLYFRHHEISVEFISELERVTELQYQTMPTRNLAAYVQMMGKMGIRPNARLLGLIQNEFINQLGVSDDEYLVQHMASIVHGFAIMNVTPSDLFLKAWQKAYISKMHLFTTTNLVNSLFGFYIFGAHDLVVWLVHATPQYQWNKISKDVEVRLISMVWEYYDKVLAIPLDPLASFEGEFLRLTNNTKMGSSNLEKKFEFKLALSGVDYEREFQTDPGFLVDFYLPETQEIIQVDGPLHFIREIVDGQWVETQRRQDQLMDDVLNFYGYKVRRVDYHSINKP